MAETKTATKNTNKWTIEQSLGTVGSSDVTKTLSIPTAGTYVDRDIEVIVSADASGAAELGASATGSATISSVTVGAKSGNNYPVTGSATITGTATATTTTSGFATQGETEGTGATSGTANLSANIPAAGATVTFSSDATPPTVAIDAANDNILASAATTTKPTTGYYAAVKATAPATTLTATEKKVDKAGYLGAASEITASASTNAKDGADYYVPIEAATIGVKEAGATGLSDYTENTDAVVPSQGYLTIEEGYIPKTKISLATLVPNDVTIGDTKGDDTILPGTTVYDADGVKHTGTMPNATFKDLTGTVNSNDAYINQITYNSTGKNFTVRINGTTTGTVTAQSDTAGYIAANTTAKSGAVTGTVSGTTILDQIKGTASATASLGTASGGELTRTEKPSEDTWIDGAYGTGTSTKPTSGVYVQVDRAEFTQPVTATPSVSVTTSGFGTKTDHGITAADADTSKTVTLDKGTIYVPIKGGAARVTSDTITASVGSPIKNTSTGKYDISVTGSKTINGTVVSAGWISGVDSGTVSVNGSTSLNAATLTHANTATENAATATLKSTASTVTTATSGSYYITVGKEGQTAGSVKHTATVTEGYVPADGLSKEATIATSANVTSKTFYFASTSLTNTVAAAKSGATTGYLDPVTVAASSTVPQLKMTGSGSGTTGSVLSSNGTADNKYINYYTGSYTVS